MRVLTIFVLLINLQVAIQPMISWEFTWNSSFQIRLQMIDWGFWLLFILAYFVLLLTIWILYFTVLAKNITIIQKLVPFIMAFYPVLRLWIIKFNNLLIYFDFSLQIIYSLSILIIFYSIFNIIKSFILKQ